MVSTLSSTIGIVFLVANTYFILNDNIYAFGAAFEDWELRKVFFITCKIKLPGISKGKKLDII